MPILIIGLPRAGKTTYSTRFENVVHADEYPGLAVYDAMKNASVCEGIFATRQSRKLALEAWKGKERTVCVWLDTPLAVCLARKGRSERVIQINAERFQPPTYAEGWDEIIRITAEDTSAF